MPGIIDVLIVEDDPMVAAIHRRYIAAVPGFITAGVVSTGTEALAFLIEHRVRLIILDILLPDMDGIAALLRIREQSPTVGVIVVSAARDVNIVNRAIKAGAYDYIIKPFEFERMQTSLLNFQKLENRLEHGHELIDQDELDRLMQVQQPGGIPDDLPKGLNPQTLRQIRALLERAEAPMSAVETARELGISRITARRYLEYLVSSGGAVLELEYQKIGRPTNRYRVKI